MTYDKYITYIASEYPKEFEDILASYDLKSVDELIAFANECPDKFYDISTAYAEHCDMPSPADMGYARVVNIEDDVYTKNGEVAVADEANDTGTNDFDFHLVEDIQVPLEPGTSYEVVLTGDYGTSSDYFGMATGVGTYDADGNLTKVTLTGTAKGTYSNYPFTIVCNYTTTSYDVYYTDSDRDEVAILSSDVVTTRPKVEPAQYRTITTVGTTVTKGPWQFTKPAGTEGTNWEQMKETFVVRKVLSVVNWEVTQPTVYRTQVREIAEITDPIHGDVYGKKRAPKILENVTSHDHKDNETVAVGGGGAVRTRRIKRSRNALISLLSTITHATINQSKAIIGNSIVITVSPDAGYTFTPGTGANVSLMNGSAIPAAYWSNGTGNKKVLTIPYVEGDILIKGTCAQ